jgi:uncharacterized membrane protein YidH (DUF202 family)
MARPDRNRRTIAAHADPGLQPERTTLAWGRTVLALITTAAVCLRWVTHHGVFVLTLFAVAVGAGAAIHLGQRARYARNCRAITEETVAADAAGVLDLATATAVLGVLGLYVVLAHA